MLLRRFSNDAVLIGCLFLLFTNVHASTKINLDDSAPFKIEIKVEHKSRLNLNDLSASLGDYDISAMLVLDSGSLYFNHSGAVPPGRYTIKIEVLNDDGEFQSIYHKELTFYREAWQTNAELTTTASYALNSKQNDEFVERVNRLSESALRIQAKRLGQNYHLTTRVDLQHRSDGNTLSGEKLEIPNYYVGVEKPTKFGTLGFALGNQAIENNGLVFNSFNRRGISARLNDEQGRYDLKAFVMNTDPSVSSERKFLPQHHTESHSEGLTINFIPFKTEPSQISIQAGYLDARSQLNGIGIKFNNDPFSVETNPLSYGGKTWFIATSSHWFEQSLNLQAEQAQSQIDLDGFGYGEPEQEGDASRYRVTINSRGEFKDWFEAINPLFWEFSIQQQKVGASFYSMANLGLAGDLQTTQSSMQFSWSQVQLTVNALKVRNNIENNENLSTQNSTQNQFQVSYIPNVEVEKSIWKTIGRPTLSVQLGKSKRNQDLSDALILGADINDETLDSKFSTAFQHDDFNWSLQHSRNKYINRALSITPEGVMLAPSRSNTKNQFTSLALTYRPQTAWSFSPTLQRSNYKEHSSGNSQTSFNLGFQANMSFLTNRLVVYLNHNSLKQDSLFAEELLMQTYQTKQSSVSLNWLAKKAEGNNPGLKVAFNATWNEREISLQDAVDNYQLLLKFEVYWSGGVE
ncbi:MAG: hypothetical protein ACPGJI_00695 [Kangiellaceae bacterium]